MARKYRLRSSVLAFGAVLSASVSGARAQDDAKEFDRTPRECVNVPTIDQTQAIDDQTILFFMRGRKVYRNYLPRTCPNLARYDRFAYQPRGTSKVARLCRGDSITVLNEILDSTVGSCRLGEFRPISPEEVESLTRKPGATRDAIKVETVQLPPAQGAPPDNSKDGQAPKPVEPENPKD